MESMRQQGGCAHRLPRLAHSWARAWVSRVKKAGHWALFGEANKSQVNGPNIIENLSKASRLSAYSPSSKDNLGKTGVSRGLGATLLGRMMTTHLPSFNSFATAPMTLKFHDHPFFSTHNRVVAFVWLIASPVEAYAMPAGRSIGCFADEGPGVHRNPSNGRDSDFRSSEIDRSYVRSIASVAVGPTSVASAVLGPALHGSYAVPRARESLRTHASNPHGEGSTARARRARPWDRVCLCRVRAL
eukprot:scaffold181_cov318-Pavlova_lutheri.AAC.3